MDPTRCIPTFEVSVHAEILPGFLFGDYFTLQLTASILPNQDQSVRASPG